MSSTLDAIDWKILKEMQDDGRITNVELARRVGLPAWQFTLSASAANTDGIAIGNTN